MITQQTIQIKKAEPAMEKRHDESRVYLCCGEEVQYILKAYLNDGCKEVREVCC